MMAQQTQSDDSHQAVLMRTMKFDDVDLEANRKGIMSSNQRTQIQKEQRGLAAVWGVAALIPMAAFVMPPDEINRNALGLFAVAAIVCFGISLFQLYILKTQLAQPEVKCVEGEMSHAFTKIWIPTSTYTRSPTYIEVDHEQFNVPLAIRKAFVPGWSYRLYYLASAQRLLSAEIIHEI